MEDNEKKQSLNDAFQQVKNDIRLYYQHESDCITYFAENGITWETLVNAMRNDLTSTYSSIIEGKGVSQHVANYEASFGSLDNPDKVEFYHNYIARFDTDWMVPHIAFQSFDGEQNRDEELLSIFEIEVKPTFFHGEIDKSLLLKLIFSSMSSEYSLVYNEEKKLFEVKVWVEDKKLVKKEDIETLISSLTLFKTIQLCSIYIETLINYSLEIGSENNYIEEQRSARLADFNRKAAKMRNNLSAISINEKKMRELNEISEKK